MNQGILDNGEILGNKIVQFKSEKLKLHNCITWEI